LITFEKRTMIQLWPGILQAIEQHARSQDIGDGPSVFEGSCCDVYNPIISQKKPFMVMSLTSMKNSTMVVLSRRPAINVLAPSSLL
jgi:hypothetical protein